MSLASAAEAQTPAPAAPPPRIGAPAISAASARQLHAAFEHLYSLDFKEARALFEAVIRAEPKSATARVFLASALLYEILAHQGTLLTQLFTPSNEFLRANRLPPDPALKRRFHELTAEARQLAETRRQQNPDDPDALFALGLLNGNLANYAAGVDGEYVRGFRAGERAQAYHERLRKLRPDIHDTGIVLGIHQYILGSLPAAARFFLFFVGARGNRLRGVDYLEDAARQGEYLRTYGQILCGIVYLRAEDIPRARAIAEDLHARYPRNQIFALELARAYRLEKNYAKALESSRALQAELSAHPHNPRLVGPEDALLEIAFAEAAQGDPRRALATLGQVDAVVGGNKRVEAQAALESGKLFDQLGQRAPAQAAYDKVIRLAADPSATKLAQKYRKRPYKP